MVRPASAASHAVDIEELADYLDFSINGQSFKGWVWRSPFESGDTVDVVGNWEDGHFKLVGIRRVIDRTIALYPHFSRGRSKHWNCVVFWWTTCTSIFMSFIFLLAFDALGVARILRAWDEGAGYLYLGIYAFFAFAPVSMNRRWMPFVRLAENIFYGTGIPKPQ